MAGTCRLIDQSSAFLRLTDAFAGAALQPDLWIEALRGLADATGSARAELVGVGAGATPFNWLTDLDDRQWLEFLAITGADPLANYRVAAAMRAQPLSVVHETHYEAVNAGRAADDYIDFCHRWDMPHGCQATLTQRPDFMIGLSVLKSERDGRTTAAQRALFGALQIHARAAVRTQMAIESQGHLLVSGAFETMGAAAFILDGAGLVRGLTPSAEAIVTRDDRLTLRASRLHAVTPADDTALQAAISKISRSRSPPVPASPIVVLRPSLPGQEPLVLEVLALPTREWTFGFEPRAIVVARRPERARREVVALLMQSFALTPGEAEVAEQLSRGLSREEVAANRRAAVATVRVQIKSIFRKLDVTRERELAARVNRLR